MKTTQLKTLLKHGNLTKRETLNYVYNEGGYSYASNGHVSVKFCGGEEGVYVTDKGYKAPTAESIEQFRDTIVPTINNAIKSCHSSFYLPVEPLIQALTLASQFCDMVTLDFKKDLLKVYAKSPERGDVCTAVQCTNSNTMQYQVDTTYLLKSLKLAKQHKHDTVTIVFNSLTAVSAWCYILTPTVTIVIGQYPSHKTELPHISLPFNYRWRKPVRVKVTHKPFSRKDNIKDIPAKGLYRFPSRKGLRVDTDVIMPVHISNYLLNRFYNIITDIYPAYNVEKEDLIKITSGKECSNYELLAIVDSIKSRYTPKETTQDIIDKILNSYEQGYDTSTVLDRLDEILKYDYLNWHFLAKYGEL